MTFLQSCELVFLALCVWREARGEGFTARLAVAYSILNRVEKPSWWGRSVMEVVFKRWQYSSLTDPHDPQLTTWPIWDSTWQGCLDVADKAIGKKVDNPVPHADSYFDVSITAPAWATDDIFIAQVGRLRFYNVDKDYERP